MEAQDLKDQSAMLDPKVVLVTPVPLALLDLRVAPVSLASKDNWVMLEFQDSKERQVQRESLVPKVLRE